MLIRIKEKQIEAELCKGLAAAIGFMFYLSKTRAKILILNKERISLHMLFVFFPLLAIFLNSRKRVVDLKVLRPFTFYTSQQKAKYVIEIPLKISKGLRISIGDKIKFISEQKFKG